MIDPPTRDVLVARGEMLGLNNIGRIIDAGIESVYIRSVLTCETRHGVCSKCYGLDLARGEPVNVGEAVGVVAMIDRQQNVLGCRRFRRDDPCRGFGAAN